MEPIYEATIAGDLAQVQRLIQANPRLMELRDTLGLTPLAYAAGAGHLHVAKWLLDQGR